jgi:hypothetical protein
MKPNIDRNGRIARAITGLLCIIFGLTVWLIQWPETFVYRWIVSLAAVAVGAFQLFEAKRGWCVARACGLKTPM